MGAKDRVPSYLGRVLSADGEPVGTCFQVASGVLVTAFHVLDELGRGAPGEVLHVDSLSGDVGFFLAEVVRIDAAHDLAVLKTHQPLSGTVAGFWATDCMDSARVQVLGVSMLDDIDHGYRYTPAIGRWVGPMQQDGKELGVLASKFIAKGMSGAPVRRLSGDQVVGVISGRYNAAGSWNRDMVWVARVEDLKELLDGVVEIFVDPFEYSATVPDGALDALVKLSDRAGRLELCVREMARKLGCRVPSAGSGSARFIEEVATLLFSEERALATLSESLVRTPGDDDRDPLNKLLALGRSVHSVRLLSVTEHYALLEILGSMNAAHPTLISRAARVVLQWHEKPAWLQMGTQLSEANLASAVDYFEVYDDFSSTGNGAGPMPLLLRLTVFLSAAVADEKTRQSLDEWCDGVLERLGVGRSVLAEYRAEAARWAKFRPRSVTRIAVALSRDDLVRERYRCRIWLVREGKAPEREMVPDGPYTAEEVGRRIHEVAECCRDGGDQPAPWVDVVVEQPDELQVPVDGWTASSVLDDFVARGLPVVPGLADESRVLGAEYLVALRLREYNKDAAKERERRSNLQCRWETGNPTAFVVRDAYTTVPARKVWDALKIENGATAWVVLHGPPADRSCFLQLCLGMGVPVVLWDRAAGSLEHAQRLEDVVGNASMSELPHVIQRFRKDVYHDAKPSPARPVLVWDDPDVPLPPVPNYDDPPDAPRNRERMAVR